MLAVCKLYVCMRERPRAGGESRLYAASVHNKHHFVAKTWTRSVDFIILFTVFIWLANVVVGFGYFSVVIPLK